MGIPGTHCLRCGAPVTPSMWYCATCGEVVDPVLAVELRDLHTTLRALDEWVTIGKGDSTVRDMRTALTERYLSLRTPPATTTAALSSPTPVSASSSETPETATPASTREASRASNHAAASNDRETRVAAVITSSSVEPRGPVFSWRAFIAEQAIAIMAYLGGFLLLVATLSFELGGWQALGNQLKLLAVCVVYVVFGALGLAFRRTVRLETVGRAYLAIFALMTPLLALAVYRFALEGNGFPPYGMLCLAAAYAAVVYLLLAWRTGFASYAYLGWTALGVSALAIVLWADAPREWMLPTLMILALLLLAVAATRGFTITATLRAPAEHLGAIASGAAAIGTLALGLTLWRESAESLVATGTHSAVAFALAACAQVPVALTWSYIARGHGRAGRESLDVVDWLDWLDWLIAASVAQAALGVAAVLGADVGQMTYVLAVLALAEGATAMVVLRTHPERNKLRYLLDGLALALAIVGALITWNAPAPNWPLAVVLGAGTAVALAIAIAERQPGWILVAGGALSLAYHAVLVAVLPASPGGGYFLFDPTGVMPAYLTVLALAEWSIATALIWQADTKRYAGAVYLVALANALHATALLPGHSRVYATVLLAIFAIAALAAGRIANMSIAGGITTGFFGVLAVLPYTFDDPNGIAIALAALIPALAALGVRQALGRRWAYAPYVVALAAAVLADTQLLRPGVSTLGWSVLGVPFVAWVMSAVAMLASIAAVWERDPQAMAVPPALVLLGFAAGQNAVTLTVLIFALAAAGVAWRELRGRMWGVAWYAAAALASPFAVARLGDSVPNGPSWQVIVLLSYGACAYLLAARERMPELTALAGIYGAAAAVLIPPPQNLVPTLILTFTFAAAGIVIRQGVGRSWALVFYGVAVTGSLLALSRITPYDAGVAEALLLIFAAIAYLAAALEREPLAGIVSALYAASVVVARPDAHALLPLALLLGVLALAAGRAAGPRWAWPLYVAAAVTGVSTAALGTPNAGFDAWAFLALALLAYAIAAVESRADVAGLALLLGGFSLTFCASARGWSEWQALLAFAALAWAYFGLQMAWRRIPWLKQRGAIWWAGALPDWQDPRLAGARVHGWGALALAVGTAGAAIVEPNGFTPHAALTEVAVVAILSCGAMLAALAWSEKRHMLWYTAGETVALAVTWQLRWFGADNIQAFVLAPSSYQILVGALLAADERMGRARRAGPWFSLGGSLLLLVPTLSQSFLAEPTWIYAVLLALEALLIAGIGAGTRSRLIVLTGSVFVGAAAVRGAALAVSSNVPIALVIAALALLLMGGATWLSLRVRREATTEPSGGAH